MVDRQDNPLRNLRQGNLFSLQQQLATPDKWDTSLASWLHSLSPTDSLSPTNSLCTDSLLSESSSNLIDSPLTSNLASIPTRSSKRKREAEDQYQARYLTITPTSRKRLCNEHALTRRALNEIDANIAPGQATPNKGKKTAQTGMNTPDLSDKKSSEFNFTHAKIPPSTGNIRWALDAAGMRYDDEEAWNRYPELRKIIETILDIPRGSTMRDESHRKVNRLIKEKRFMGEDTFQKKVFPAIVPTIHRVDTKKRDSHGSIITAVQDYEDVDDLEIAAKPHFARGFVPNKMYGKRAKEFGLTEPVPDQAFGKKRPLHAKGGGSGAQLPVWLEAIKSLNTKMEWPFMVCENKTEDTIAEAENQAIRDCAVIVSSRLALKRYVENTEYKQPLGADPDIYCFSLCFGPDFCRISVHWFEKVNSNNQEECYFHMTPVGQYFTNEKTGQGVMRARIHNIWDFGLVKYHYQAAEMYRKAVIKWREIGDSQESAALAEAAAAMGASETSSTSSMDPGR